MKRLLVAAIAFCACAFSGLSAAYLPWQHGTYRGGPPGPDARLAYFPPNVEGISRATQRAKAAPRLGAGQATPVCYRFKFDEDLQFIRCY